MCRCIDTVYKYDVTFYYVVTAIMCDRRMQGTVLVSTCKLSNLTVLVREWRMVLFIFFF